MTWCPKCKSEYREDFETCADCGGPLVAEEPSASPQRRGVIKLLLMVDIVCSLVLATVTYVAAMVGPMFFAGSPDAVCVAVSIATISVGGTLSSLLQPRPAFWRSFGIWAAPPTIVCAAAVASIIGSDGYHLQKLVSSDTISLLGSAVSGSAIGACTATMAGKWFSGERKYGVILILCVLTFVSAPLAVDWFVSLMYR